MKLRRRIIMQCIWGMTFIYLIIILCACNNIFVFPQFNLIPVYLTGILGAVWVVYFMIFKGKGALMQILLILVFTLLAVLLLHTVFSLVNPRQRHQEYPSPDGRNTVIIEYDFMDRPSIYQKKGIFMEKLYEHSRIYNETTFYEISWLGSNTIELANTTYPEAEKIKVTLSN